MLNKLNDKEQKWLSEIIEDHLWRQYNFYKGSDKINEYEIIKKRAYKMKSKLTDFIVNN